MHDLHLNHFILILNKGIKKPRKSHPDSLQLQQQKTQCTPGTDNELYESGYSEFRIAVDF